ncbi:MAG: glycosyltransferase [Nocardiopsaceae bacterium]|nr:glycosyltransferase [Nocardiopsaceae bacterium]
MRILLWHMHGTWTTAFVQGGHDYLIPLLPGRPPDGRGRPSRPGTFDQPPFDWPPGAVEMTPSTLHAAADGIDVAIAQRPEDLHLIDRWTGRAPGAELPTVYVEHNTPPAGIAEPPHPAAEVPGITVVHVTHFNDLFWDCGKRRTEVIEHGLPDPGYRYTGDLPAAAAVINEPVRRGRVTGTDLLRAAREKMPVDLFGLGTEPLGGTDLPHSGLLDELPRRRVYLHPVRWTSLGLSLIEAMHLGMPVAALATTEVPAAVPPAAGVTSTDFAAVTRDCRELIADPEAARRAGRAAREHALARYGLNRFLADWDRLLSEVASG